MHLTDGQTTDSKIRLSGLIHFTFQTTTVEQHSQWVFLQMNFLQHSVTTQRAWYPWLELMEACGQTHQSKLR